MHIKQFIHRPLVNKEEQILYYVTSQDSRKVSSVSAHPHSCEPIPKEMSQGLVPSTHEESE